MKRFVTGLVSGVSALSIAATAMGATFSDVTKGSTYEWALPYIEEMVEQGFISGYDDGTFKPAQTVSRLEAISLFARAMGSRSEYNAAALEYAMAKYEDFISTLKLNFGREDIAYMLYRGVLTTDEAKAYLYGGEKNKPMPRYEAATIITKAMSGENTASETLILDLDYKDVSDIPSASKKYVYYVTQKEIMTGMGGGLFSPKTAVLRSQIAVMLKNTVDEMLVDFSEMTIDSIDTREMTLTLTDADGESYTFDYNENTSFFLDGEKVSARDIPSNAKAVVTQNFEGILYVDVESSIPDEEVSAIFNSYQNKDGILYVVATTPGSNESTTYECVKGINNIKKNDKPVTVRDLKVGDYLDFVLSDGKVVSISAVNKDSNINSATIDTISYDGSEPFITIKHADSAYDGMKLQISSNVEVLKDGESVKMTDIYRGDKVSLTLEYGIVSQLSATSIKDTIEGTIREINISSNPTIVVLTNGEEIKYDVPTNAVIIANGEDATLYDFRIGDKVTLITQSNAITKIESVASQATEGVITGTVVNVNPAYQFIKLSVTDSSGNTYEESIYCKDTKTTIITAAGATKLIRDVKEGNLLSVFGTYTNGAFEATSVVIIK